MRFLDILRKPSRGTGCGALLKFLGNGVRSIEEMFRILCFHTQLGAIDLESTLVSAP